MSYKPQRIISGGQTGADRAALDWAIARGIPHGGFCPCGRLAEDGVIDPQYRLIQTRSSDYRQRTLANAKSGDSTLIFVTDKLSNGSKYTRSCCVDLGKPHLVVGTSTPLNLVQAFLAQHCPSVLNIAGTRASKAPEIAIRVWSVLDAVIGTETLINNH